MKPKYTLLLVLLALIGLNAFAQDYRKMSTDSLRADILKKLNDKTWYLVDDQKGLPIKNCKAISITEDSLIFKSKNSIIAIDLNKTRIIYTYSEHGQELILYGNSYHLGRSALPNDYKLQLLLMCLSDKQQTEKYDKELAEFQKLAKTYNELNEKPTITEEQRKYIVQANATNEKKDYRSASQLFRKVIEINPTSYPAAYFNLALISAQTDAYEYAIFNMKKYLLLVPDAPDARAAQDKIYEWEFETEKKYNQ